MLEIIKEKWNDILMYAKEKYDIDEVFFRIYLLPLQVYSVEESYLQDKSFIIKIFIPGELQFCGIKSKYGLILEKSIEKITGIPCEVEFAIECEYEPEWVETVKEKWDEILMQMKQEYGMDDESFDLWLSPLQMYGADYTTVKIIVPDENRSFLALIGKKYGSALKLSIEGVVGVKCRTVRFFTESQRELFSPTRELMKRGMDDYVSQAFLEEHQRLLRKDEVFIYRDSILGKKILEIIRMTRQKKETQCPDTLMDLADLLCDLRSYLHLPEKQLKPFSRDIGVSLFEHIIDVEIMAVAAAIYHDIYESDVYMIDGKYYLATFFRPNTLSGANAWDKMLLALSFDLDINDKTIRSLSLNCDEGEFLNCASEIKMEMRENGRLGADFVFAMRIAQGIGRGVDYGDFFKDYFGNRKHEYEEINTYLRENNRKMHNICPELKWFTDLMERESIVVRYETREKMEYGGILDPCVLIYAYDTRQNYAKVGTGAMQPYGRFAEGYFTIMKGDYRDRYPYGANTCPMHKCFKDVILKIVRDHKNKRVDGTVMEETEYAYIPQPGFLSFFSLKKTISFKEWILLIENLKNLFATEHTGVRIMEYNNPEDFKFKCYSDTDRLRYYCPAKYGTKTITVINQNDY